MRHAIRLWAALGLAVLAAASAQDEGLTLGVHRVFGYGAGSRIQGVFRLEARGPADLTSVTFTLDGEVLATIAAPPFETRMETGDHALGWHTLGATGLTAAGETLTAPERRFEFVSGDEVWQTMGRILLPIVLILLLAIGLGAGVPLFQALRARSQPPLPLGAPRRYGWLGGTICPRCRRPFARHWWGLNLPAGKLDRCDHCGRWSVVQALPRNVLAAAEAAELTRAEAGQPAPESAESAADRRRRAIEESRWLE